MKGGLASSRVRGLLYEDRNVCGSNEGGTEATSRAKRRGEGHEDDRHGQKEQWGDHATAASGGPERCLHERVPDEQSGALRCIAGYHSWENGGNDDDARNDCSVGRERAAEFDDYAEIVINERTHGDYGLGQVGAGSRSAHGGASPQGIEFRTRRHAFLDNLVPLAAFEGILDCNKLPPSATTPLSRARRRWLLSQWHNRMSVSPSTAKVSMQHREDTPRHLRGGHSSPLSPSSSSRPTPTTLEVDDLFFVGVGQRTSLDSTGDIVGLEEQIKREECSEGRMARRRAMMEATKKAVCEALVLWSKKADLLQAKLVVLRTVASSSTLSTLPGSGTSTAANTNTMSLEEYLTSPSPRCCACNTRGGYQQEFLATSTTVPASDTCSTTTAPAAFKTNPAAGIRNMHDGNTSTGSRGSSLQPNKISRKENNGADGAASSQATDALMREERLVTHLEECLKCMTHLRDWLRTLDQQIG
ncbi:unnamed protein product [Pylaiella littoralis]